MEVFTPTHEAALARIAAISPSAYARTRNALDGSVTRLSPYLTHGIISLPEAAAQVACKHRLSYADKLVFEFGWREFFHHVWAMTPNADDILQDMRPALLPRSAYADVLPADLREGRTGVPCIDAAVCELYATGYVHNHARMWLASYCVHLRKVHWRAGADWLYGHLLDGDLPSNHLSWQWVAATFSAKPYLFNADNVAQHAPQSDWKRWHSRRTVIDQSYEALEHIARTQQRMSAEPGEHAGVAEPALLKASDTAFLKHFEHLAGIEPTQNATELIANKLSHLSGQQAVELITPWSLSERSNSATATDTPAALRIGFIVRDAHDALPWSVKRWQFVLTRMLEVCDAIWIGNALQLTLLTQLPHWPGPERVIAQTTLHAGYRDLLPRIAQLRSIPKLFVQPQRLCSSFSKFYEQAQRGQRDFSKLMGLPEQASLL